jgi:3-phenylpropionate/trans-cinnamate dioxygenase ferredoxin component
VSETEVTLADGLCTHAAVHLCDGALIDGQIECPKHNARFDARNGQVIRKPAARPLVTYDVAIDGDRLITHFQRSSPLENPPVKNEVS